MDPIKPLPNPTLNINETKTVKTSLNFENQFQNQTYKKSDSSDSLKTNQKNNELQDIKGSNENSPIKSTTNIAPDLSISTTAGLILAQSKEPILDLVKLQNIKEEIKNGTYKIDYQKISQTLIQEISTSTLYNKK